LKSNANTINRIYTFHTFYRSFLFLSFFLRLDLLAATTTSKVVVDLVPPPGQMPLAQEKDTSPEPTVPLAAVKADEIGSSGLPNKIVWFAFFEPKLSALVRFVCEHILVILLGN
jgi:hypothetical protein